jgi:ketosteroid isomerase-like protein
VRAEYDMREKTFNAKRPEEMVRNFYSEDAISVAPGDDITTGREKLIEAFKAHMGIKVHIVSYQSHVNGNNGIDWTNLYYTPDDPKEKPGVLKMLFLWEKRDGKWVCIGDMWAPGSFPVPTSPR